MTECETCPYRLWPTWCFAASGGHRALCRPGFRAVLDRETLGADPPPPATRSTTTLDVERAMRIATCRVRESDCHCASKPAVCRLEPDRPRTVVCTTAGPDGGPCPGADRLSSATASR